MPKTKSTRKIKDLALTKESKKENISSMLKAIRATTDKPPNSADQTEAPLEITKEKELDCLTPKLESKDTTEKKQECLDIPITPKLEVIEAPDDNLFDDIDEGLLLAVTKKFPLGRGVEMEVIKSIYNMSKIFK